MGKLFSKRICKKKTDFSLSVEIQMVYQMKIIISIGHFIHIQNVNISYSILAINQQELLIVLSIVLSGNPIFRFYSKNSVEFYVFLLFSFNHFEFFFRTKCSSWFLIFIFISTFVYEIILFMHIEIFIIKHIDYFLHYSYLKTKK